MQDDNATILTQLGRQKIETEALAPAKESTEKTMVDVEAQVTQLLQDKVDLKKLHSEVDDELTKVKDKIADLQSKLMQ